MNIPEILSTIQNKGVRLSTDGLNIHYEAPEGAMTPEIINLFRENKAEIMRTLKFEEDTDTAFDILDCLLAGGLSCKISEWKKQCREAGVGELAIAMVRFVEAEDFVSFDEGIAKLKDVVG